MARPLLEIIALTPEDAIAAEAGGADRLEVVTDMEADGLTPSRDLVATIRSATSLPLRCMLRPNAGFSASVAEIEHLCEAAEQLESAGADGFVFGFLDEAGAFDEVSTRQLATVVNRPWTFHRAIDHSVHSESLFAQLLDLPGLDTVLTAGSPQGLDQGVNVLAGRVPTDLILAGGGLKVRHIPVLFAAGIRQFHLGSAVRQSWASPVKAEAVGQWRDLLDALPARGN
nr:copper homeostasis protein CutC [Natronoglycomyces albus]